MKILVTGANGMLGSNLLNSLSYEMVGLDSNSLDVTKSQKAYETLSEINPDVIIHTAAFTNVEQCEEEEDKAYLVNTLGTQNIVNYAIENDILFIYISSTGVYGTKKQFEHYTEFDEVHPTTVHHHSKYEAEKIIQQHLSKYLILRTGWLFGGNITHDKNFVYKRFLESKKNQEMFSDDIQIGNPTYISDLVNQIDVLIQNKQYGLFNCVNEATKISRYDYVTKIIEYFGVDCVVEKAKPEMFLRKAKVSSNESARNYKLDLLGLNVMGAWDVALCKYIEKLKKEV